MPNVDIPSVIIMNVDIPGVIMLSAVMRSAIVLRVVAPNNEYDAASSFNHSQRPQAKML